MTTQTATAGIVETAVRQFLEHELGAGTGQWAAPSDRESRPVALAGLGTTVSGALGSGLLASALAAQSLEVSSASPWTAIEELLLDPTWDLGLVLSPFKTQLADRVGALSPSAERTGIVDTVVRRDGVVVGLNTNAWALEAALGSLLPGVTDPTVLVLGVGGTARSALLAITRRWSGTQVRVSARRRDAATELLARFDAAFVEPADTPTVGADLIINSTTWGETADSETSPFAFPMSDLLRPGTMLFDLNNRRSALQDAALAAGCTVMSGTLMQRVTHACRAASIRCILDGGGR